MNNRKNEIYFLKENATLKHIVLQSLQTMNFDTNLIKIGGELRKLWTVEYCNIGCRHFEYLMKFHIVLKIIFNGYSSCKYGLFWGE